MKPCSRHSVGVQPKRSRKARLSTLGEEKRVNPFLRTREKAVVAAARRHDPGAEPGAPTLAVIRAWKDRF